MLGYLIFPFRWHVYNKFYKIKNVFSLIAGIHFLPIHGIGRIQGMHEEMAYVIVQLFVRGI